MHKIFMALQRALVRLVTPPPSDPLAKMSLRELADLPPLHPDCRS